MFGFIGVRWLDNYIQRDSPDFAGYSITAYIVMTICGVVSFFVAFIIVSPDFSFPIKPFLPIKSFFSKPLFPRKKL